MGLDKNESKRDKSRRDSARLGETDLTRLSETRQDRLYKCARLDPTRLNETPRDRETVYDSTELKTIPQERGSG
ncbi:hypothetical protein GCK72_020858 [Caenorhabditis remanei]|uniref:Uncharacterized protein n=1 Tax=Caenorhabditis remanei TaxID=31234 RepID=A0A6A5GGF3_CAERE|nr:hypothetical protein GCK72_020858 [Caenorhabditis remanei]KAF1754298.1 hypothetical protein GCK72_020858 [Caenorhabditis remanei]